VVLVTGDNGAGKTNLLEAIHVGTQGFSPRTRNDARLIRLGEPEAAVGLRLDREGVAHEVRVRLAVGAGKNAMLDGTRLPTTEALRRDFPTLVFTPDRLSVVKGGPAVRRAYFDRAVVRLLPAKAALPQDYAAALAQRNAALRRVQLGLAGRDVVEPWTARVAASGAELVSARQAAVELLQDGFCSHLEALGLPGGSLEYEGEPAGVDALEARLDADLARGATGLGPHLDDFAIEAEGRDLRGLGSQGEQRLALLALILAEASLIEPQPLLLLDDVLSELDSRRREVLARSVASIGQTVITTTHRSALPASPAQVVEVTPGSAV
jgi:DNA replication and repair protein RecF